MFFNYFDISWKNMEKTIANKITEYLHKYVKTAYQEKVQ